MKQRRLGIRFILIGVLLLIILFPLYWMVINSFKQTGEFFTDPTTYWDTQSGGEKTYT